MGEETELVAMRCDGAVHQLAHTPPGQGGAESPRWGRDGRVYVDSDRAGRIHLFRMEPVDAAAFEQLFSSHGDSFSPTVSADLFVMRDNGGHRKKLTREPPGSHSFLPAWSPDGRRIVYTRAGPDQPGDQLVLAPFDERRSPVHGATVLYTGPPDISPGSVDSK